VKKIDVNQIVSVLANVGVIIGILFLALEVNQNSKQLRAQAQFNYMQSRAEQRMRSAYDPEFAAFLLKISSAEQLTDVEQTRFHGFMQGVLLSLEWEYAQTMDGNFSNDRQSLIEKWRSDWRPRFLATGWRGDQMKEACSGLCSTLSSDFIEFFEGEIIGEK
jgi:hypothetical protein